MKATKTRYKKIDLYVYNPVTKQFAYYASTTWHGTRKSAKRMLVDKLMIKPEHVKASVA